MSARDAAGNVWVQREGRHAHRATEREFQAAVIELAGLTGWAVYHTHDSRRSAAGFPDLVLARDGQVVLAELKRDAQARVTPEQHAWLAALAPDSDAPAQHAAYLWTPASWGEIEAVLTGGRERRGLDAERRIAELKAALARERERTAELDALRGRVVELEAACVMSGQCVDARAADPRFQHSPPSAQHQPTPAASAAEQRLDPRGEYTPPPAAQPYAVNPAHHACCGAPIVGGGHACADEGGG